MRNSGQSSPLIIQANTQYMLWTLSTIMLQNKRYKKWGTLNMDSMEGVAFQEAGFYSGETY